jgi:hypothetical protein
LAEDYMRCIREISMTSDFEVKTAKTVLVPSDAWVEEIRYCSLQDLYLSISKHI